MLLAYRSQEGGDPHSSQEKTTVGREAANMLGLPSRIPSHDRRRVALEFDGAPRDIASPQTRNRATFRCSQSVME